MVFIFSHGMQYYFSANKIFTAGFRAERVGYWRQAQGRTLSYPGIFTVSEIIHSSTTPELNLKKHSHKVNKNCYINFFLPMNWWAILYRPLRDWV